MASSNLLTVPEVAGILGLTKFQVYRRIHRGDLLAINNTARGYLIHRSTLDAYIAAGAPLTSANENASWVGVTEVSEMIKRDDNTVRSLCQTGVLKYARTGPRGHYRIQRTSVEDYLKNN